MDDFIVVAVAPPEVFDLQFLAKLKSLHFELDEKVPYAAEITSLINARNTRGEGDTLIVEDLLESWPKSRAELADLRQRVLANPLFVNNLISDDSTFTTVVIRAMSSAPTPDSQALAGFDEVAAPSSAATDQGDEHLTSAQQSEMVDAVVEVVETFKAPDFPVYLAGGPVITHALNKAVPADIARTMPPSTFMVVLFLAVLFRRVSGVFCPLIVVLLSLFETLGLMAALGIPITSP